ncbi:hypothetical protein IL306_005980 [Fusarium sp. DS 682]|nr:hypothetical protein IL306_005980 [Fusarium sp. DS 682]
MQRSLAGFPPAPLSDKVRPDRIAALEERLANIEALLTALGAQTAVPATQQDPSIALSDIDFSGSSNDWDVSPAQTPLDIANCQHAAISNANSHLTKAATSDQLELAPLSEILPLVDNYFRDYNKIVPLFEENAFMRMLLDWYSSSSKHSMVSWAAINVVLAINYRILEGRPVDDPTVAQCLRNARSVMSELMTQGQDLIGLQDMAQKSRCPYHQPDSETDMELPDTNPEDNLGVISSSTDNIRFNYLRSCAKFAFIQGKAHDILYSQKSQHLTPEKKASSIAQIEEMLIEWADEIPPELRTAEGIEKRLSPIARHMMTNVWSRHIETRIKIHSIFTFEDTWINRSTSYGEHPEATLYC